MDQYDAVKIAEARLNEVLESGGKYNNPDAGLVNDYIFWLRRAAKDVGGTTAYSNLCVRLMDRLYSAKSHNDYQWIDRLEMTTVINLKIADAS